jgi:hypothetical protein
MRLKKVCLRANDKDETFARNVAGAGTLLKINGKKKSQPFQAAPW